jgi:cobalt-zinc-cadmium efflux system membrane fusion protein
VGGAAASGEYLLRAPIAGRVSQMNLAPGGGVEAMSTAAVIDRDDRLWAEARLPAAFVGKVKVGAPVSAEGARGRVVAVGSAVDPRTRSVVLRAELPAGGVAGKTVWLTLYGVAPSGSVSLPRNAVIKAGKADMVFVREAGGFRALSVKVAGISADQAVVTGLRPGVSVVITGASQLKSAAGI